MKITYSFFLIILMVVPVIFNYYPVTQTIETSNQTPIYFQTVLSASNNTLTSFDIEKINLNQQESLHLCLVNANSVLYNDFSFNQLQLSKVITFNDFKAINLSTNYINNTMAIQACQYFPSTNYNIIVVYYSYVNQNYASIFVLSTQTSTVVNSKVISNVLYYKTNKLIKFSNSNDLWIEMRNASSFFILNVDNSNGSITKQFQSPIVDLNSGYFSINDVQFSNDQLYVLYIEQNPQNINPNSSGIFIFSIQNGTSLLQTKSITSSYDYYSSITTQNNHLYALSEINSSVTEYDLTTFQQINQIGIGNGHNDSLIRSFDDSNFIICSFNSVFEQYTLGNNNLFHFSKSLFTLYNPQSTNEEYTLELLNSVNVQSYFLAGYTKSNNVISGFALVFENINTQPSPLIDPSNNLITNISSSLSISTPDISTVAILLIFILLIFLVGLFYVVAKRNNSPKKKDVDLDLNTKKLNKSAMQEVLKTCPVCGSKIIPSDVFCQNCGNKL